MCHLFIKSKATLYLLKYRGSVIVIVEKTRRLYINERTAATDATIKHKKIPQKAQYYTGDAC